MQVVEAVEHLSAVLVQAVLAVAVQEVEKALLLALTVRLILVVVAVVAVKALLNNRSQAAWAVAVL
jgi:hypothetical protein